MSISWLPYVMAAFEVLVVLPLVLYLVCKLLKVESESLKFSNCVWMIFIAGLLGGFVGDFNIWLGLALFVVLVGIMMKTQFKADFVKIVVVLLITGGIALGLEYLRSYIHEGIQPQFKNENVLENETAEDTSSLGFTGEERKNIYCEYNVAINWSDEMKMEDALVDSDNLAPYSAWGKLAADYVLGKYGLDLDSYSEIGNEGDDENWFMLDMKTCVKDYEKTALDLNDLYAKFKVDNSQFFK